MKKKLDITRLCTLAVCVSLAMIFSFIESQIPPLVAVPGVKIGLANIVSVFLLYTYGAKDAGCVSLIRVVLSSILFGSLVSLIYSLSGAILSLLIMIIFRRIGCFSSVGVSVLGGVFHNVGQVVAACIVMSTPSIAIYLPVLLVSGVISGTAIGLVAGLLTKRLDGKLKTKK